MESSPNQSDRESENRFDEEERPRKATRWSQNEQKLLIEMYVRQNMTIEEIAERIPTKTLRQIEREARKYKICRRIVSPPNEPRVEEAPNPRNILEDENAIRLSVESNFRRFRRSPEPQVQVQREPQPEPELEPEPLPQGQAFNSGKWSEKEHKIFEKYYVASEKNNEFVASKIKTRTADQVRSHAQKFVNKRYREQEKKHFYEKGKQLQKISEKPLTRGRNLIPADRFASPLPKIIQSSEENEDSAPVGRKRAKKESPRRAPAGIKVEEAVQMDEEENWDQQGFVLWSYKRPDGELVEVQKAQFLDESQKDGNIGYIMLERDYLQFCTLQANGKDIQALVHIPEYRKKFQQEQKKKSISEKGSQPQSRPWVQPQSRPWVQPQSKPQKKVSFADPMGTEISISRQTKFEAARRPREDERRDM